MVEKAIDVEVRASLQPLSGTREVDFRCPKGYKPSAKKEKDEVNQKHWDANKDKDKAKFYNSFFANSEPQI